MSKRRSGPQKIRDPEEIATLIMDWFERENKPVTPQFLTDALGSRVSKALIQKSLEELLSKEKLQAKDLRKVRFFFLNITSTTAAEETDDPLAETGQTTEADTAVCTQVETISEPSSPVQPVETEEEREATKEGLVASILEVAKIIQEEEQAFAQLSGVPTAAERHARIHELTEDIAELQEKVSAAEKRASAGKTHGGAASADQALELAVYRYQRARQLWKERREFTDRLIDGVLGDACMHSELSEMFGITTDSEAGVSFTATAIQIPSSLQSSAGRQRGPAPRI